MKHEIWTVEALYAVFAAFIQFAGEIMRGTATSHSVPKRFVFGALYYE